MRPAKASPGEMRFPEVPFNSKINSFFQGRTLHALEVDFFEHGSSTTHWLFGVSTLLLMIMLIVFRFIPEVRHPSYPAREKDAKHLV
jgi:hypothetical protein